MNNDLISRTEAMDAIRSMTISLGGAEIFHPEAKKSVLGALDDLATVDADPVRHSRWKEASGGRIICGYCGNYPLYDYFGRQKLSPVCWNCGAKMMEEE